MGDVVRISDYERRSREPDACQPRDPCDATVIVLPVVKIERYDEPMCIWPWPWASRPFTIWP